MKIGRPEKQEGEKALIKPISFPPDLWDELVRTVPKGKRSAFIQSEVRRGLARLKRRAGDG